MSTESSGFFDILNRSRLAVSKKAAGAGVVGLVGFFLLRTSFSFDSSRNTSMPSGSSIRLPGNSGILNRFWNADE